MGPANRVLTPYLGEDDGKKWWATPAETAAHPPGRRGAASPQWHSRKTPNETRVCFTRKDRAGTDGSAAHLGGLNVEFYAWGATQWYLLTTSLFNAVPLYYSFPV